MTDGEDRTVRFPLPGDATKDEVLAIVKNVTEAWVRSFFPATFDPWAEARRVGVKWIWMGPDPAPDHFISRAAGSYNPFTETIQIDPDTNWVSYAAAVNARHPGLDVTPGDAIVYLLFHECGHASRREHEMKLRTGRLNRLGGRPISLDILVAMRNSPAYLAGQLPFVDEWIQIVAGEKAASAYAAERFKKWKGDE